MVIFVWGASVFFAMSRPPDETLNIYVVGKQWMWKFQHLDGQREINELHVPVGRAGEADHDVRGRHPRRVRPGVPRQGRRDSRPLHAASGSADQAGPLSPVLRRVLRHAAFRDDRRGRRDGAERVPDVAERRRAGGIARLGRREAVRRISRATPAIAPTRRAAGRCSRGCSARRVTLQSGETVDRRRGLRPRIDSARRPRRSRPASSRSCRRSRGWSPKSSCSS